MDQHPSAITRLPPPTAIIGTWRRFGPVGPVYEVVGTSKPLDGIDHLMRIRVLESGEELDYQLSKIVDDPREA
jgi:hypothetical protein